MFWLSTGCNHMLVAFVVSTTAWSISSMSMGFHEWRVWYVEDRLLSQPMVAFVGIFEACISEQDSSGNDVQKCYGYTHQVPLGFWISQYALAVGSIMGLFSHVSTILLITNVSLGRVKKNITYNPFLLPGIMNLIANVSVLVAVMINYDAVQRMAGVDFHPSVPLPVNPDAQEIGSALLLAGLGSFLYLLSAHIFFIYPRVNQVS